MARLHTITQSLSTEQFAEMQTAIGDPYFFAQFIYLIHPTRGKTPFDLYPFQKRVLWYFLTKQFNIVLKFRQAGITELISLYCLWFAMYHANKNVVILSLKERVAKKVLRKIKFMYKNLPAHMQIEIINGRPKENGTATEMEFANGSTIASLPTTEDAGRSEAVSVLVIDEAAIMKWANVIWAAAYPTLSTGGKAIVNSTPYGVGNWYHNLWVNAVSGGNDFWPIRLRWQMHPERYRFKGDTEWYDKQRAQMGPRKTAQEIDGDFLTSGASVFDLMDIRAMEEDIRDMWCNPAYNEELEILQSNRLIVFKRPIPNEQYYVGGDVSTGRSRDYSAFSIMNRKGEEYACFKGKVPVNKFAEIMMEQGRIYNRALLAPEGNDIGLAVVAKIQDSGYDNLYYATTLLKEKKQKKPIEKKIPGWLTTKENRPVIIDGLEEDIRMERTVIKDPHFVHEAYTFIYDDKNKPIAMGKNSKAGAQDEAEDDEVYTDDTIMAKAITNHIRKGKQRSGIVVAPAA